MSAMVSQITGVPIVAQPFAKAQIRENIKAPHHLTLWGDTLPKESVMQKKFDDVIMEKHDGACVLWRAHVGSAV